MSKLAGLLTVARAEAQREIMELIGYNAIAGGEEHHNRGGDGVDTTYTSRKVTIEQKVETLVCESVNRAVREHRQFQRLLVRMRALEPAELQAYEVPHEIETFRTRIIAVTHEIMHDIDQHIRAHHRLCLSYLFQSILVTKATSDAIAAEFAAHLN